MPESMIPVKASVEKRFECHAREFLPTASEEIDVIQSSKNILMY